ncbi:serine/threonine protein kinase, partial [Streptomyces sp. WAC 05379]
METIIVQPPGPSGPDIGGGGKPELLHMGPG